MSHCDNVKFNNSNNDNNNNNNNNNNNYDKIWFPSVLK